MTNTEEITRFFDENNKQFLVFHFPPIMMALITGKLIIFFFANIAWTIVIIKGGWATASYLDRFFTINIKRNKIITRTT